MVALTGTNCLISPADNSAMRARAHGRGHAGGGGSVLHGAPRHWGPAFRSRHPHLYRRQRTVARPKSPYTHKHSRSTAQLGGAGRPPSAMKIRHLRAGARHGRI